MGMQAEQQLEKGWELMKAGTPGCPDMEEWLVSVLPEGSRVGIDPFLHTVRNPSLQLPCPVRPFEHV